MTKQNKTPYRLRTFARKFSSRWISFVRIAKKGVNDFVSEMKHVENYPDFEKLAHVTQHGLQGFIFKNIKGGKIQNYRSCGSFA